MRANFKFLRFPIRLCERERERKNEYTNCKPMNKYFISIESYILTCKSHRLLENTIDLA